MCCTITTPLDYLVDYLAESLVVINSITRRHHHRPFALRGSARAVRPDRTDDVGPLPDGREARRVSSVSTHWTVGIDGSDHAHSALRWATAHATGRTDEIVALAVYHVPVTLSMLMAKRAFDVDRLGIEATTAHDIDVAIQDVLGGPRSDCISRVVEGHPAPTLVEQASDAELLVVGQRGAGEGRHTSLGSVSRYCSTHSATPVVVIPPDWSDGECRTITVGFDGSPNAERALRWALEFGSPTATIQVIIAIEVTPWLEDDLVRARFPEEVERETTRLVARLGEITDDPRVQHEVVLQDAREALIDAAARTDLLVVGARGRGPLAAKLLGSVTNWLLHHATCPTAVIPQRASDAASPRAAGSGAASATT
jgi:nucleotide-binding universal stress UspA family protein